MDTGPGTIGSEGDRTGSEGDINSNEEGLIDLKLKDPRKLIFILIKV